MLSLGACGISTGVIQCGAGQLEQELQTQVVAEDMDTDEIVHSEDHRKETEKGTGKGN